MSARNLTLPQNPADNNGNGRLLIQSAAGQFIILFSVGM